MSLAHVKYLLVGGGIAASSAAEAIRAVDPAGLAMLVGQEITRPYNRPPLSKQYLRHEVARDALFTRPNGWFREKKIELHTGHRITRIDTGRNLAVMDTGLEVCFDQLLIAIGASPVQLDIPGASLPNVFSLRTLEDADRLYASIEKAKNEGRPHQSGGKHGRAVVIGGGLLGVELAASLTQTGVAVDFVCASETPWDSIAGDVTGKVLARLLEHQGVTVHLSTTALRLEGDGRVQRVVLSDGTSVDTDLVVGAIGVAVNRQLLRGTSIRAEKAILTDEHCRTNVPNIYAAGDCAAVLDPVSGKHRIGSHWAVAAMTGSVAGANMAGGNAVCDGITTFTSEVFGVNLQVYGEPRAIERRILRGTPRVESPSFVEIGVTADGTVAQVIAVGEGHDLGKLEAMVKDRVEINGNEETLKDPDTPL